jgi:hypothetical protein
MAPAGVSVRILTFQSRSRGGFGYRQGSQVADKLSGRTGFLDHSVAAYCLGPIHPINAEGHDIHRFLCDWGLSFSSNDLFVRHA